MPAKSYGFYSKGCFSGGVAIPVDGPTWQAMRLSRNRRWGHPTMIALIEKLSRDAAAKDGWPGLLIGDISQPRGGPMLTGHASHQIGLDADIWLTPMPSRTLIGQRAREHQRGLDDQEEGPDRRRAGLDAGACAAAQARGELSRGRAHPRPSGHQEEALRDGRPATAPGCARSGRSGGTTIISISASAASPARPAARRRPRRHPATAATSRSPGGSPKSRGAPTRTRMRRRRAT